MTESVAPFKDLRLMQLNELVDACLNGRRDVAAEKSNIVGRIRELYEFVPGQGGSLLEHFIEVSNRAAMSDWSSSPGARMSDQPWYQLVEALRLLREKPPLYARDWSRGPIEPQFPDALTGRIDLAACARYAQETSTRRGQIDPVKLLTGSVVIFRAACQRYLTRLETPESDHLNTIFDTILTRDDVDLAMFPHALTYLGDNGVYVHNELATETDNLRDELRTRADRSLFDSTPDEDRHPQSGASDSMSSPTRVTSASPQADSPTTVALTNPERPEDEPKRMVHRLLSTVPMCYLIYGAPDIDSCSQAMSALEPVFVESHTSTPYIGRFPRQENVSWIALDGPSGSAIAILCGQGSHQDFTVSTLGIPLRNLQPPWSWSVHTAGAEVPAGFDTIFRAANVVPIAQIAGLEQVARTTPNMPGERPRLDQGRRSPSTSRLLPILAVAAVALVVAAFLLSRHLGPSSQTAESAPTTNVAQRPYTAEAAVPVGPINPAALPIGAVECSHVGDGPFSRSARGNDVTSCPFSENVRQAFLADRNPSIPKPVQAFSPVTQQWYTMTCTNENSIVVCRGGNDAVVDIYSISSTEPSDNRPSNSASSDCGKHYDTLTKRIDHVVIDVGPVDCSGALAVLTDIGNNPQAWHTPYKYKWDKDPWTCTVPSAGEESQGAPDWACSNTDGSRFHADHAPG